MPLFEVYCPNCGGNDVVEIGEWFAKATEDPDNTALIYEWQCRACHNQSFWIPEN
jgi:cytochrome c5